MRALSRAIDSPPTVDGVGKASPMAGLSRRALGMVDVLAQSAGAVAPTAAAVTTPALVAGQTDGSILVCMLLAWALSGGVCWAVGHFARRLRAPGSLYTFTTKGLGPGAGFAAACALIVGYGFVAMFGVVGASLFAGDLLHEVTGMPVNRVTDAVGVVIAGALCYGVLRRGIRISARVTLIVEAVAVLLVLALLVTVLAHVGVGALDAPFHGRLGSPTALVAGTTVAISAFVGFESAAALGREARRPFLTIPRTMRWTLIGAGLVYVGSLYTQQVGAQAFGVSLADNDLALTSLADHSGVSWLARLLELGQVTSLVACAIASLTALSRVVFTLGREGLLSPRLGQADPLRGTPRGALVVVVPVTIVVPLVLLLGGWAPWDAMKVLIVVSVAGYLLSYVLVIASAPLFLARIGELTRPTAWAAGALGTLLAGLLAVYLCVAGEPVALVVLAGLVLVGGTSWGWLRRARGRAVERMGMFDETTADDLLGAADLARR
ncbi:MAG: APC family permease [Nocardioides sp.]|uniref:APC family permease n=1 Tax=Nocardioides sp. TaxID=35761 RepID=UPI0039E4514B